MSPRVQTLRSVPRIKSQQDAYLELGEIQLGPSEVHHEERRVG